MLKIRAIMDSPVEDIFAFKTCCGVRAFDQNLEIHVTNQSDRLVEVPSYFDLKGDMGSQRVDTLMPHGEHRIAPGETIGFYCIMDEVQWKAARQLVFYDTEGNSYAVGIAHPQREEN